MNKNKKKIIKKYKGCYYMTVCQNGHKYTDTLKNIRSGKSMCQKCVDEDDFELLNEHLFDKYNAKLIDLDGDKCEILCSHEHTVSTTVSILSNTGFKCVTCESKGIVKHLSTLILKLSDIIDPISNMFNIGKKLFNE